MNKPLILAGLFALLSVLFTAQAEDLFEEIPYPEIVEEQPKNWLDYLDGRVSFIGGDLSSDDEPYAFAKKHGFNFSRTWGDYLNLTEIGEFVELSHPKLTVEARHPHVLSSTAEFVYEKAEKFADFNCGNLTVTGAGRLSTRRLRNGSPISVHPAGMAVDLRIIKMNRRCRNALRSLLKTAEAEGRADTTEEKWPPHLHVVVIPPVEPITIIRHRDTMSGQGF